MKKPIRIFWSELTNTFYASQHYKEDGKAVVITGQKYDVTQDIARAINHYGITFTPKKENK